jgi:desulfoferrodoxin (superoxide reductase-like protein)
MLYDEYDELVKEEFLLPESETKIIFNVSDLDDYMIVVRCSIHGLW